MQKKSLIKIKKYILGIFLSVFILSIFSFHTPEIKAETVEELEAKIREQETKLQKLEREITQQQVKVDSASREATSLQGTVNSLSATEKKISTDISKTQTGIETTTLLIRKLGLEIEDKNKSINSNTEALGESIRRINEIESVSLIEIVLGQKDISEFWNAVQSLAQFHDHVQDTVIVLKDLSEELVVKKTESTEEKEILVVSKEELAGQKESVVYTKKEKAQLLAVTRNEESEYKKVLDQKLAEKAAFAKALLDIESRLKIIIDPTGFPTARNGILNWPVSGFIITQQYGNTSFAKNNPQFYSRGFHNGTDMAVPIGTPVKAAMDGVVAGTDNTDLYPGCRSWGGWVMVNHPNGLSTMHAHLSSVIVKPGQTVVKGQTLAYSGSTGISTGPHLHFTLYASQGVEVRKYRDVAPSSIGCGATGASIPIASLDAYLDPMKYLPSL